jgi:hypothetical protein
MDPQAAWDDLVAAYLGGDFVRAGEFAESLIGWLDSGGFPPRTSNLGLGEGWDRAVSRAGAEHALLRSRGETS